MTAATRPADIFEAARAAGVEVLTDGQRIGLRGPREAVQRLRPLVALHRGELLALLAASPAANDEPIGKTAHRPAEPPARRWDHAPASAEEIERMAQRTEQALNAGLTANEADALADRLHQRDRERDDRRLCLECRHLRADADGWRCASARGLRGPLARDLVVRLLQRCSGFEGAFMQGRA